MTRPSFTESRWFKIVLRFLVTLLLFGFIGARLDVGLILAKLRTIGSLEICVALVVVLIQTIVLSYRWQQILESSDIRLGFQKTAKIVIIGLFFNQCLPTSLGGDGVRVLLLRSAQIPLGRSINAVLVDRLSGLAGLLVLLVPGLPFAIAWSEDRLLGAAAVGIVAFYGAVLAAYFFADLVIARIKPFAELRILQAISEASGYARHTVWRSRQARSIWLLALLTHLSSVVVVMVLVAGLNGPMSVGAALVLVPPIFAVAMLPISFGGWGARELAMMVSLGLAGVPAPTALAVSILVGFVLLVSALPGAVIWLSNAALRAESRAAS